MLQSITRDILSSQIVVTLEKGQPVFTGYGWAGYNNCNPIEVKFSILIHGMPAPNLAQ